MLKREREREKNTEDSKFSFKVEKHLKSKQKTKKIREISKVFKEWDWIQSKFKKQIYDIFQKKVWHSCY